MYKILKINIQEHKLKYVILKAQSIENFVLGLNSKNIENENIEVSIGSINDTSFLVMEKYCLFNIDSGKSIKKEIEEKGFIILKKNIEKFISGMFYEKDFLILEPKYNEIIEKKGLANLFNTKEDIKKFLNHYIIIDEYFKVLKSDNVGINYLINNNKIYIRFQPFNFNRNEIKNFNKNKKLLKLSNSNFIKIENYNKLFDIEILDNNKTIKKMFEVLNNQEIKKGKLVSNFLNYFIPYIYGEQGKEMKRRILNLIPSYKNYAYNKKESGKEYYKVSDKTLKVYMNYNKTLLFYKGIKKIIDLVFLGKENEYSNFIKNYKDFLIKYIKNNKFENDFLNNVLNNISYLENNYQDYVIGVKHILENNKNITKEELLKELKKLKIEEKNKFNIYSGYDLGVVNNSKQISKILKIFKSPEYNEL